jgi:hypothetical protein
LRQGWERFLSADGEVAKQHQFAELLNALEIAAALCIKKVFVGVSRELLSEYLDDVMGLLRNNDDAKQRLETLIHSESTFKFLALYLRSLRNRSPKSPRRM